MARADTWTLLCIDDWARYMAIHPDAWNQVINCQRPYAGACERVWIQNGWLDHASGRILGREDVAIAIATAEEMIAHALGFWPAPTWIIGEEHQWPLPARGAQVGAPPIALDWGQVISGGQRALTAIALARAPVYSDHDGDGVLDTATVTVTAAELAVAGASAEEVAVYFHTQTDDTWMIRCLTTSEDPVTGNVAMIGRRSQFVDPALWLLPDDVDLCVDANFVTEVDVYRRYNDTQHQVQLLWKGGGNCCSPAICSETCQDACLSVEDSRRGIVHALPGTYTAGAWASAAFSQCRLPDAVRVWYYSGILLQSNGKIRPLLAEAIVRLANTYLVDEPCGCAQTIQRWTRDREEMEMNSYDAQLAMSAFGNTMRGAIFAWSAVKRIPPLVRGGALT